MTPSSPWTSISTSIAPPSLSFVSAKLSFFPVALLSISLTMLMTPILRRRWSLRVSLLLAECESSHGSSDVAIGTKRSRRGLTLTRSLFITSPRPLPQASAPVPPQPQSQSSPSPGPVTFPVPPGHIPILGPSFPLQPFPYQLRGMITPGTVPEYATHSNVAVLPLNLPLLHRRIHRRGSSLLAVSTRIQ